MFVFVCVFIETHPFCLWTLQKFEEAHFVFWIVYSFLLCNKIWWFEMKFMQIWETAQRSRLLFLHKQCTNALCLIILDSGRGFEFPKHILIHRFFMFIVVVVSIREVYTRCQTSTIYFPHKHFHFRSRVFWSGTIKLHILDEIALTGFSAQK